MKYIITLVISLMAMGLHSQSIKYKKGIVKIDGKEKYKLNKVDENDSTPSSVQMQDMQGNTILEFKDAQAYYDKLYYELKPRPYMFMNSINFNALDQSYITPHFSRMNVRKALHKILENTDFYKTGILDEGVVEYMLKELEHEKGQALVDTLNVQNIERANIANLSKEMHEAAPEREPSKMITIANGKIKDNISIGTLKLKEEGSYSNVYEVSDLNKNIVATLSIEHFPGHSGNLNTLVDEKSKEFEFEKKMQDSKFDPTEDRQKVMVQYLVNLGYL